MKFKRITGASLAFCIALGPMAPASAGNNNGVIPGLFLGAIAAEIIRGGKGKRRYRTRLPSTSEGREIQTSLNYFGFPAGRVDGQLGKKSRTAISNYQTYMGFPTTGKLADFEMEFLFSSYERAMLGGDATTQLIASTGQGPKGLLKLFQQEQTGAAPQITNVLGTSNQALPDFFGESGGASLASHCNKVSLLTNTNGGFMTETAMSDPNLALGEQFCLARTYAIANGEDLASKVTGFTPQQIAAQCETFGPAMKDYISALSLKPRDGIMQDVGGFVLNTGMSPSQLSGTARICLSVGYRTDNMDVAIGSALLLTVLGEKPYGELLGHHLGQGFGTTKRPDLALAWYQMGLNALENGAEAVFAAGQPERNSLIQLAVYSMNGAPAGALGTTGQTQATILPTFSAGN